MAANSASQMGLNAAKRRVKKRPNAVIESTTYNEGPNVQTTYRGAGPQQASRRRPRQGNLAPGTQFESHRDNEVNVKRKRGRRKGGNKPLVVYED